MTEEAKELINCIRVNLRHNKCFGGIDEIGCKLLLDCIANLQQDLDKANEIIEKDRQFYKCRMDEYAELKKENEFLKLNNPKMNIEHFRIVKENKRKIDNLRKENERLKQLNENASKVCVAEHKYGVEKAEEARDYKSRCEKANKIITDFMCTEEYCSVDPIAIAENYMEIQKALNGSDESE